MRQLLKRYMPKLVTPPARLPAAGARGPVAGMMHAVFLLLFMLLAAPFFAYVPLAPLAAVLAVIAWNMAESTGS